MEQINQSSGYLICYAFEGFSKPLVYEVSFSKGSQWVVFVPSDVYVPLTALPTLILASKEIKEMMK